MNSSAANVLLEQLVTIFLFLYSLSLASSMAGMEIFGYGLTLIAFVAVARKSLRFQKTGVERSFLIFAVVIGVGALLATGLPTKLRIDVFGQLRWILLLYALTAIFTKFSGWQKKVIDLVLFFYVIASLYGIAQAFTGWTWPAGDYEPHQFAGHIVFRSRGFFSNTMSFSYCLGQCLALVFAMIVATPSASGAEVKVRASRAHWVLFLVFAVCLLCTFTRGAWVGAALAIVAMSFLYNWRFGVKVLAGVVGLVVLGALVSPMVRERLLTILHENPGQLSVSQRYDLWKVNWQMFKDHPFFGVGYGYNYYFTPEYNLKVFGHEAFAAQAHNNFLQVLAGAGIFGFVTWLYFCGYFFWLSAKTFLQLRETKSWLRSFALGLFGAQIFFHFGGLTQSTFFDAKPLHLLIVGWAILLAGIKCEQGLIAKMEAKK
jgi:O-antigen ligase